MADKVRFDNITYEYSKDRNYVILPDGRRILVAYTETLGNHGWVDLTTFPYKEQVSFAVEPINTRFPLYAILTQDGKSVILKKDYLDSDTFSNVKAVSDTEQFDIGEYFSTDRKIKQIKVSKMLDEIYCLDSNNILLILDKRGDLLKEVALDLNADFIELDASESLLFYAGQKKIGVISLTTYDTKGQINLGYDIRNIKIDFRNNLYAILETGLRIINVTQFGDPQAIKTISLIKPVNLFMDEINEKIYVYDEYNELWIYDRNTRNQKSTVKLSDTIKAGFIDYVAEKLYLAFRRYIIVIDTKKDIVFDVINISDIIGFSGVSYAKDIYAITNSGDMFHLFKDIKKKVSLKGIHGFESDDEFMYFFDDVGGVFKAFIETYIPKSIIEINRGRNITGSHDVTVHINLAEVTKFPDQISAYENPEDKREWISASPLLYYSFDANNTDVTRKLYVEITDKKTDGIIILTSPTIHISSRYIDTRYPEDVTDLLKAKVLKATDYMLKADGNYGVLNLRLEADHSKVDVDGLVTFKVVWIINDLFKVDLTSNSTLVATNPDVGYISDNTLKGIQEGTVFVAARIFDVYSNTVKVEVVKTEEEASLEERQDMWRDHSLILSSEKNSIDVNEVIDLKVELASADGNRTDLTNRVKIADHFPDVAELVGAKVRGVEKGEAMFTASIGELNSNTLSISVYGDKDEINKVIFERLELKAQTYTVNVGQSVVLSVVGFFNDGEASASLTDEADFQVLDLEIGRMEGYIFYSVNPGTTPIVASYKNLLSNVVYIDVEAVSTQSVEKASVVRDRNVNDVEEFTRGFIGVQQKKRSGARMQQVTVSAGETATIQGGNVTVSGPGGSGSAGGDGVASGEREIDRLTEGKSWAERGLSDVSKDVTDIVPMTTGLPTLLERKLSPDCIAIHSGKQAQQKVDGGKAPIQLLRQVKYCVTSVGLDFTNEAKLCVEISDGVNWHAFNVMDNVSIWMKGPKPNAADINAQLNSSNSIEFRDPALVEFTDDYVEDKKLSYTGRNYNLYKDKVYYDGVQEPTLLSEVEELNKDNALKQTIKNAFLKYKIPVEFISTCILSMSGLNRKLINNKPIRRMGLMQITQSMAVEKGIRPTTSNLLDPVTNIDIGCYFINKNRGITELDLVRMAAVYGVGRMILEEGTEWGVKEPSLGFITKWVNYYNSIILSMKSGQLSF